MIAQAEGFKNILIEPDLTLAVNFASQLHPYAVLIQQIRSLHYGD
jgi:hypothetical protein